MAVQQFKTVSCKDKRRKPGTQLKCSLVCHVALSLSSAMVLGELFVERGDLQAWDSTSIRLGRDSIILSDSRSRDLLFDSSMTVPSTPIPRLILTPN